MNRDRSAILKRMAELLRAGATMLAETCPKCNSPLFRLKSGEVLCPIHGKVMVVRSEEEYATASATSVLMEVERIASTEISRALSEFRERGKLDNETFKRLFLWLRILERTERIKKLISETQRLSIESREGEKGG
ncbi:MAG: hypothetical protein DRO15_04615 [Thermoprotei archaeon]|nr:MAG: hypothetical protein DRO15_04615 [Thermoprotei archaeon]